MGKAGRRSSLLLVGILVLVSIWGIPSVVGSTESESLVTGPYVDEVTFKVISDQDERILALQSGDIQIDTYWFNPECLDTLELDPDISVVQTRGNGYTQITINCAKYPLNISGFRRAFAYAYNKTKVVSEPHWRFRVEHDSIVPQQYGWCIEDQFQWSYYSAQPDIGNQILDDLNFTMDSEMEFREAPNGLPFSVTIEYPTGREHDARTAQIGVDALSSLGINAEIRAADYHEFASRLISHGEYDMIVYRKGFYTNDVDWLAYEYGSEYADAEGENPTNFVNETYDSWVNQLLYSTSYGSVYEASAEMQRILHYNVPVLVIYETTDMYAYRNDQYTGYAGDLGYYSSITWTLRNMRKIDGSFGGSFSVAIPSGICSFNVFSLMSVYCYNEVIENLWPSLYKYGPDRTPIPDIAENILIETHSDNPTVPDGHTRFTIDIVTNATWSDGVPLTADDVIYSYLYAKGIDQYGYPAGRLDTDLFAAYPPTLDTVVLEYSTESYWHFSNFAFRYLVPKHIFSGEGGIGYEGWSTWNPIFDETHPHVTCGPFIFTEYDSWNYYKMEKNPLFHYAIKPSSTTTSTTNTTTTTSQTTPPDMFWPVMISTTAITGLGMVVIVYVVVRYQNRKR